MTDLTDEDFIRALHEMVSRIRDTLSVPQALFGPLCADMGPRLHHEVE